MSGELCDKKKEKKNWKTKRENHNRYIEYLPKFMKRKSTKRKDR